MEAVIIKYINETFNVGIPQNTNRDQLELLLAEKINNLILHDFSLLVHILYRIDVSEKKLKALLKENAGVNAGRIIAALVIERQLEKIRSRRYNDRDINNIIGENESW